LWPKSTDREKEGYAKKRKPHKGGKGVVAAKPRALSDFKKNEQSGNCQTVGSRARGKSYFGVDRGGGKRNDQGKEKVGEYRKKRGGENDCPAVAHKGETIQRRCAYCVQP